MFPPGDVANLIDFKLKAIQWASGFHTAACLDSNSFTDKYSKFGLLIAAGVKEEIRLPLGTAFEALGRFREKNKGWVLGMLNYDLKNETEDLTSNNPDHLHFPELYFFVPEHIIIVKDGITTVLSDNADEVHDAIEGQQIGAPQKQLPVNLKPRFSRKEYTGTVKSIQQHIARGDSYETTFCQEFFAENIEVEPVELFNRLNEVSPAPFSCFFKLGEQYILSASPERFLAKRGDKLISQPIKGTTKRGTDAAEDEKLKNDLLHNVKEQQENVMIVDLVRNDLTKCAEPGTVQVEELFGIYSFEQVHQMISTVVCQKNGRMSDTEVIKQMFPMGSMTGAPKLSAMQLIERYERSKRGVYSGALGYFAPDGDFDFSVVIRTLLYDQKNRYLSYHTGSAITHAADPEKEYEECMLKAKGILQVLSGSIEC